MAIESERWEDKRQGDVEGIEESSRLPIEAMARICDRAFFEGYKIVRGFDCTVRIATPQHIEVATGFAFPGLTPNIPIDLEAAEFAHILAGTDGIDGFGNGLAADATNPRFDLVVMTRQALATTPATKYFVDDSTDPPTYPQAVTNTRYNNGDFVGGVVHGTPTAGAIAAVWAARGAVPANYVVIAVVYIPAGVTSLSDPGVIIVDTDDPWPWVFTPPWPTDVRADPVSDRVSSLTATAPLAVDAPNGPVTISLTYGDGMEVASSTLKAKLGNGLTIVGGAIAAMLGEGLAIAAGAIKAVVGNGLKIYPDQSIGVNAGTAITVADGKTNVDLGTGATQAAAGNHTHAGLGGGGGFVVKLGEPSTQASPGFYTLAVSVNEGDTAGAGVFLCSASIVPGSVVELAFIMPGDTTLDGITLAVDGALAPAETRYGQAIIPIYSGGNVNVSHQGMTIRQLGYFKA